MKIEPEALYSLYKTLFIPIEKEKKTDVNSDKSNPNIRILMLFDQKPSEDEALFLNKILNAINIKPDETESNYEANAETLAGINTTFFGKILIWGIDNTGMEKYKLSKEGENSIILSDSLNIVMNNQTLKVNLWNCLKENFIK